MEGIIIEQGQAWLIILIFFTVLEAATGKLIAIRFATGALSSLLTLLIAHFVPLQIAVFLAVSALSFAFRGRRKKIPPAVKIPEDIL